MGWISVTLSVNLHVQIVLGIFPFGHQMGLCAKYDKNLPSSFFMGINGLIKTGICVTGLR